MELLKEFTEQEIHRYRLFGNKKLSKRKMKKEINKRFWKIRKKYHKGLIESEKDRKDLAEYKAFLDILKNKISSE